MSYSVIQGINGNNSFGHYDFGDNDTVYAGGGNDTLRYDMVKILFCTVALAKIILCLQESAKCMAKRTTTLWLLQ